MAQKTLTAKVKFDTTEAERNLARLEKKINAINKVVNTKSAKSSIEKQTERAILQQEKLRQATLKTQLAEERLTTQKHKTALAAQKVTNATDKSANSANKLATAFNRGNSNANTLLKTVRRLAATYLGVMGAKAVFTTADTITSAQNRLNNLPGGNPELTRETMDKIYSASQRSRSGYGDMLGNVSKSMTLAGDAFKGNIDNAIRFQEIMSKSYTVGGASAAEASSSMYQLVQALGSGVLQGDELRSVREGAPIAYKAIEKFAQGVLDTEESLKDLASQGVITSDIIVAALLDKDFTSNLEKQFENTKMTFAQSWTMFKNTATKAFEPVLEKLTEILNKITKSGAIDVIAGALVALADTVLWLMDVFGKFFNWCADNWEWLKYVISGVLLVIIALLIKQLAVAIWTGLQTAWAFLQAYWPLLLIVAGIMAILYVYELWRQGTITTVEAICYALLVVAVVFVIVAAIMTAGVYLIIALVIAAVALMLLYFEYVAGAVTWLGAVIINAGIWVVNRVIDGMNFLIEKFGWFGVLLINLVIGWINGILQYCQMLVDPIISIIEFILNCCNGGFNSFGGAVANLIGQIISWFLSLGKVVTTIIDAIFGTDWTSGLTSLQDSVLAWGKNDNAITLDRSGLSIDRINPEEALATGGNTFKNIEYLDTGNAFDAGFNRGSGIKDSINGWGSQFQNQDGGSNLFDKLKNKLDGRLPDPNDVNYALDALGDINSDTGKIADSMELADDDLEYLRRLAEMEWRNEFTTAEIKVDMTNHNTVNGERDLDGIVSYLSDVLREEMTSVAYGVHY